MTVHYAKTFDAAGKAKAKKNGRRRIAVIGGALAGLAVAGTAFAAIMFNMAGSASAEADNGTTPTITNEHFSGKFYPGAERDLIFNVSNPNDFPVQVTKIKATSATDFSAGCVNGANLSGFAAAFGQDVDLPTAVTVPAHDSKTVTIANAVKLSADATTGCSFKVGFSVTGSGAGN